MFRFLTSSFQNIAAVGTILFTFSGAASAATISNTVSVGPGSCGSQVPETASSSGSIELEATKGGQGCQADSRAYANLGVVGVGGSIESQANIANTTHVLSSFAETKIGGIELSPATGFTFASLQAIHGNFISVGVNAEFTGDLAAEVASFSSNQRSASASLSAFVEIQGSSGPKKSATLFRFFQRELASGRQRKPGRQRGADTFCSHQYNRYVFGDVPLERFGLHIWLF